VTILETTVVWLGEHGYQIVQIDAGEWTRETDLHRDIVEALGFPDYYGGTSTP
jgi:hypothetical protein